ncbi:lipocalin family protein [Lacinutrix sp. Bg11-31]|uniref:lipocalin family protein n=1 Tax=Lacinutrix sp. Bg11-31 TaxID=2057808 RepID=UPI000C30B64C|nr:lipocalin family protein [Lacinutrix sp. Bg11-31]AUC82199.1 hypothetical protein CW733_08680 [Lacinutrix sp. Bg11-31]
MKILKTIFTVIIITLFTVSCGSDDDNEDSNQVTTAQNKERIIGTWKFTTSTTNGETDTDIWICDFEDTHTFSNTSIASKYYSDPSGNNEANCELDETYNTNYTISANTLTSEDYSQEILTLNSTTLVLKDVDEYDGNTYIYTETFTKQ